MLRKTLLSLLLAAGSVSAMQAQKQPTATRSLDIQAGGEFVYGQSDYGREIKGYGFYGDVDFRPHFGAELEYHQANGNDKVYERTYEAGGRYVFLRRPRWVPYAKGMYGRGVFNFPPFRDPTTGAILDCCSNVAYNMVAVGGGADYKLKPYLNIRGDFEYQKWFAGLGLTNGLTPYVGSIGVAYHFR
jgi:hypothetical protein